MEKSVKKVNIFCVDDDEISHKLVKLTLEKHLNCAVICFDNANDCLNTLKDKKTQCSLIITDIKMPDMDGMALLSAVKQLRPWLPVLIVSGYGNVQLAVKAVKAGAMDFVEKPIVADILLPLVISALERSHRADEIAGKPLTESEKQILKLIADGKTNAEMASLLHRSIRTVERHRYVLMKKLNASSPAELTKAAIALGLTSPEIR